MKGKRRHGIPQMGTLEHRAWVADCVRRVGTRSRDAFLVAVRAYRERGEAWPHISDFMAAGGWPEVCRAAFDRHIDEGPDHSGPPPAATKATPPPALSLTDPLDVHRDTVERASWRTEKRELLERLDEAERRAAHREALYAEGPPPGVQRRERASGLREATAIVLASDWHVEESVDPATVNGLNAYDLSVAQHRARRFFDGVSWLIDAHATHFRVRDLVLWLGGDLITGYIHEELQESNGLSPLMASRFVRGLVVEGLRMLLAGHPELERIIVPCSHGNHGRTTAKPRISTGSANSYEHALYLTLADDFRDEARVEFHVARGELTYLDVYDLKIRFTHGDAVKYMGGVGGITIPINKAIAAWDRSIRADLTCMGHWHQLTFGSKCIVNGSLIGPSAYTVRIKAEMEEGRQAFALIDSRHGVCQQTPVWTTPSEPPALDPLASAAIRDGLAASRAA